MKPSDPSTLREFQGFLKKNGLVFACAESCTGGLLARQMTARSGSSEVFWGGVVSYADHAKQALLGVSADVLARHGAVSQAVAEAMVDGLMAVSGVPLAVSITGIAGPTGATVGKPVGTVWFGLAARKDRRSLTTVRAQFEGTRNQVQQGAATWAWKLAARWWESDMTLDSLRSLTDNDGRPSFEALPSSVFFPPHTL